MLERKPRIYLPATCKGGHERWIVIFHSSQAWLIMSTVRRASLARAWPRQAAGSLAVNFERLSEFTAEVRTHLVTGYRESGARAGSPLTPEISRPTGAGGADQAAFRPLFVRHNGLGEPVGTRREAPPRRHAQAVGLVPKNGLKSVA
jgi:hypothetical protein